MPITFVKETFSSSEISLYFHIPFCQHKCPYCHFFVLPSQESLHEIFFRSLLLEWEDKKILLQDKTIVSIYFGGGTPSLLPISYLRKILEIISQDAKISSSCEITLEMNPEDANISYLQDLKILGINRISIGVQSLDDSLLEVLERRHGAKKALAAIDTTYQAGISNISIDLMYDLPHQTLSSWQKTIQKVKDTPITHLSLYNLTIEPHTLFFKRQKSLTPYLPTNEESANMLEEAVSSFPEMGLLRYEISAFAKDGLYSIHNTGYWMGRPFVGYGPSAFSFWENTRFSNIANLHKYQTLLQEKKSPTDFAEKLPHPEHLNELLAIHLRLIQGVDLHLFQQRWGLLPENTHQTLATLQEKGYLRKIGTRITLTEQGLLFYDSVATEVI